MINRLPIGLLALYLTGCASCPDPIPTSPPPVEHLLLPTPVPVCDPETNGDLLECLIQTRQALGSCNADKSAASNTPLGVSTPDW